GRGWGRGPRGAWSRRCRRSCAASTPRTTPSSGPRCCARSSGSRASAVGPEVPAPSDAEFRMLSDLLRRHCGLHFGAESRGVFERRGQRRVRELELTSIAAYHLLLRGPQGDRELARLVDELTINETYFLRERNQLAALVGEILPELRARHVGRPLAIWSAGCSSGE